MSTLFAFQLRRVARNRQYLFFTVLLPALFTVFFTKVFGAPRRAAGRSTRRTPPPRWSR
jgi:ABC-2 type transport system permease protein